MRTDKIIGSAGLACLALLFAWWAFKSESLSAEGTATAVMVLVLFAWLGLNLTPRFTAFLRADETISNKVKLGKRSLRRSLRHPFFKIAAAVVLWQAAVYALAYVFDLIAKGYEGGLFDKLSDILVKTDAPHYLGIAKNWYVTEGDPRFHIVFYPLYPVVIKAVWFFVKDYFTASLIVSGSCGAVSGILIYELALLDTERKEALRCVKYFLLLPAAFFFAAPMSESLFFMLSLGCMYLSRKKRFFLSCILGALAAFTRSLGIVLIVPVCLEMIAELVKEYKNNARLLKRIFTYAAYLILIAFGFGAYLLINYAVWGNPWQFLVFQKEHWSQGLGLFFNTAAYQAENALKNINDPHLLFGLWLPNILYMLLSLAVMIPAAKSLRASYTAYFFVYFFISMGATWLLSAPRYLTACFPLPMALAAIANDKKKDAAATVICAAGFAAYLAAFAAGWYVY
ncbi:MAG: Mannosyltransferase (PIG-V) [Firmicutes bacterium ADurb.Bin182]|nr:MAG: Mannosyltransferase (PIG-V) [Firmicutes bacterium ADurb.Bin182]